MTNFEAIRRWYKNKAAAVIAGYVIPTLQRCEADGYWGKGESRKVRAALNKTHPALTAAAERGAQREGKFAWISVRHGNVTHAPGYLATALELAGAADTDADVGEFVAWCQTFAPVAELLERLDGARPKPAYVFAAISPTVFGNVARAMGVAFSSIRQPETIWVEVELEIEGKRCKVWRPRLVWPAGTRHNVSRFAGGSRAGNAQCEACGHAIHNPRNWVPLLADTAEGPISLWVGSDCARKCFGAKISGDADWSQVEETQA